MRRRSVAFEVALAALFAAVAFAEAALHLDDGYRGSSPPLVAGLVAAVAAVPLAWRRRAPVRVLAVVVALVSVPHLVASYDPVFLGGGVPVIIATETVGRYSPRLEARWALLIPAPGLAAMALVIPGFVADAIVVAVLILAGWGLGVLVRALTEQRAALRGELAATRAAEALRTEAAVVAERVRIARDLHDVIAHCVGVMVLQAGAARLRIGDAPEFSVGAIAQIERTGHEALVELQRVLGLLRGADDAGATVVALEGLVDEVRAAGLAVRLQLEGDLAGLPPGLDRSLYRVVQESLTNALKHGSDGAVDLRLVVHGALVELEVVNVAGAPRSALPGGNGQAGMRERIAAFGGAITTGAEAGRYRVHAVVPVGEPA